MADRPAAVVAEAHVQAHRHCDPIDCARDDVEELFRPVGVAGEARFVELEERDAFTHQRPQLAVDDRQDRLGDGAAVGVHVAALDAAGQRVRPRHRHLDRGAGEAAQAAVLGDEAEAVRGDQRAGAAVAAALVVGRRPPAARRRQRFQAAEVVVKAEVEIDALHLAVGDEVGAGAQLVIDGQSHRVAQSLLAVVGAEQLGVARGVVAEFRVPAGEGPAADDGRGERRERGHADQSTPRPIGRRAACGVAGCYAASGVLDHHFSSRKSICDIR